MDDALKKYNWEQNYQYLEGFKEEHGRFPTVEENKRIHNWLRYQRFRFKRGDLGKDKAKRLNDLGFPLKKNNNDILWERRFELLEVHVKLGNDPNVQRKPSNSEIERILANWLNKQRYNFKKGVLPMDKAQRLEKVGVYFSRQQFLFEKKYDELKRFQKKHGHFEVPYKGKHKKLRDWINHIRTVRRSSLTTEQVRALNEIGFPFKSKTQRLKEIKEKDNMAKVKNEYDTLKTKGAK